MAKEVAQLPHLKVVDRVLELPIIEMMLVKSAQTYSRVKDSHQLVHWVFTTAEMSLNAATKQAIPIAVPIAKMFETHINLIDYTLCFGLDKIEEKIPLVTRKPEQILEQTTLSISYIHILILAQATNLRDISWNKANQILDTHYGSVAMEALDSTAYVIDKLIDRYFPATEEEKLAGISTQEEDKLLFTLQTLGHLSYKAARRVYFNIIHHFNTVNKDGLLKVYITIVVRFLQFTKFLQVNEKVLHEKQKEESQNEKEKDE